MFVGARSHLFLQAQQISHLDSISPCRCKLNCVMGCTAEASQISNWHRTALTNKKIGAVSRKSWIKEVHAKPPKMLANGLEGVHQTGWDGGQNCVVVQY